MPYRRYNPLQDKWVLVSPHRFSRPWSGQLEPTKELEMPAYDPACYLCPGNKRSTGEINPSYTETFTFVNDFSALISQPLGDVTTTKDLLRQEAESGRCEVLCYSPIHNKTMAGMSEAEIEQVIAMWQERFVRIGADPSINHIQIFENRGNEVGNSNPHPHGQLWAQKHVPTIPGTELLQQENYFKLKNKRLLLDYIEQEQTANERLIYKNPDFLLIVPYWVEWPYETLLLPRFPLSGLDELPKNKFASLAKSLGIITRAYAQLFKRPHYGAPYTMGIHQKPTDGKKYNIQLHIHFQPPLLTPNRSKFMVGYERFGEAQRDLTPEQAADELRTIIEQLDKQ